MTKPETVAWYIEAMNRLKADKAALESEHEALDDAFGELQKQMKKWRMLAKGASATCSPAWQRQIRNTLEAGDKDA